MSDLRRPPVWLALTLGLCACEGPPRISVTDLAARLERDPGSIRVLDVRAAALFDYGHIPGAVNVPLEELERRRAEIAALPRPLAVICAAGRRSAEAARRLGGGRGSILVVDGGMTEWERRGLPEVKTDARLRPR